MRADGGCICGATRCHATPVCALTSTRASHASCYDGDCRIAPVTAKDFAQPLRCFSPNQWNVVTATAACSAPTPQMHPNDGHRRHRARQGTTRTSSGVRGLVEDERHHRERESARQQSTPRRYSPTRVDGAEAVAPESPTSHSGPHQLRRYDRHASSRHTRQGHSRHRSRPSRAVTPVSRAASQPPAPMTPPTRASPGRVQRLLHRLEGVAAATGKTPRDGSAAELALLYQALFLQALADGAAWERHARALQAEVKEAARRERRLSRRARRMQSAVELLVACMEEAGRNAALGGKGGGAAARVPDRVDVSCAPHGTTAASTAPAESAAAADASPVVPLRAASHSAVSDLLRGSLARSLNLAYSCSRSDTSGDSDGDDGATRLPSDALDGVPAKGDGHTAARTVHGGGRVRAWVEGGSHTSPAPLHPRPSAPPDPAHEPAGRPEWVCEWMSPAAAPNAGSELPLAPPSTHDDNHNCDAALAGNDSAARARRHPLHTRVDDTPIRAAWRDAACALHPHRSPPQRDSTQARGSPMTAVSPAPMSASTATQIETRELALGTAASARFSPAPRRRGNTRGVTRRTPRRLPSPSPLPLRSTQSATSHATGGALCNPPERGAAHATSGVGDESASCHRGAHAALDSHDDEADDDAGPDKGQASAVHSLLELLRSRDASSGRGTPSPKLRTPAAATAAPVAGPHHPRSSSGDSAASHSSRAPPANAAAAQPPLPPPPPRVPRPPPPPAPPSLAAHGDVDFEVTVTRGREEATDVASHATRVRTFETSSSSTATAEAGHSSADRSQPAAPTPSRSPIPCRSFQYRALQGGGGVGQSGEGGESASHAASLPSWASSSSPPSHAAALAPPLATSSSPSLPGQDNSELPSPQPTTLVLSSGERRSRHSSASAGTDTSSCAVSVPGSAAGRATVRTAAAATTLVRPPASSSSSSVPLLASVDPVAGDDHDDHKACHQHARAAHPRRCPVPPLPLSRLRAAHGDEIAEASNRSNSSSSGSNSDEADSAPSTSNVWESIETTTSGSSEAAPRARPRAAQHAVPARRLSSTSGQEGPPRDAAGDGAGYAQWRAALEAQLHESYASGDGAA